MWLGNIKFPKFWAPVGWESCSQKYHPYCFFGQFPYALFEDAEFHQHPPLLYTDTHTPHHVTSCPRPLWLRDQNVKSWAEAQEPPPQFFHAESSLLRLLCDPRQSLSLSEPVSSSIKHSLVIREVLLFQLVIYWNLQTTHFRTYCIHFKVNSDLYGSASMKKLATPHPPPQGITSFKKQDPLGRRAETQQPLALTLWESTMGWPYTWNFQLSVSRQNDVSYNHARQPEVQGKALTPHKWHVISGRNLALIKSPFCS